MENNQPETEIENSDRGNVVQLASPVRRARRVPPLTDQEILEFRQALHEIRRMKAEFEAIKESCPLAARALSKRTLPAL